MGVMRSMRPIFVFEVRVMGAKLVATNASKATKACIRPNNEFMIAVIETIMVIMNSKRSTIEFIIAIMKTIAAVMNLLFQILNSL